MRPPRRPGVSPGSMPSCQIRPGSTGTRRPQSPSTVTSMNRSRSSRRRLFPWNSGRPSRSRRSAAAFTPPMQPWKAAKLPLPVPPAGQAAPRTTDRGCRPEIRSPPCTQPTSRAAAALWLEVSRRKKRTRRRDPAVRRPPGGALPAGFLRQRRGDGVEEGCGRRRLGFHPSRPLGATRVVETSHKWLRLQKSESG